MISFVSFLNNTEFPYISVFEDDRIKTEMIFKNKQSKVFAVDSGSVSFDFFYNSPKPFLNIYIPLNPGKIYTIKVYETHAEFM